MKIAVCDDEAVAIDEIVSLLEDYIADRREKIEYNVFKDYSLLEPCAEEYDIFLLDYMMPGVDGLSFARSVREKFGRRKAFIFISRYDEIVYDTFAVLTHRFLKKPIEKERFYEALDSYRNSVRSDGRLVVQFGNDTTAIGYDEIYYIEISHKELYVYTEKEQIVCRRPIASVEDELDGNGFFRVHRSYLVNMRNIRSFNKNHIELLNGESVPISTRKYSDFCRAYLKSK